MIRELYQCAEQCNNCYKECESEPNNEKLQRCMMLDLDCADICTLTAKVLERESENREEFLKLCSNICEKTAEECEKHSHMEHCRKCAEVCRKCAAMCNEYSSVH